MQTMSGPVVNGGLIDFQDNFHRGMSDFASYQQAQQLAGMMNGMPAFPVQQQAFQPLTHLQGLAGLPGGPMAGLPGANQLQCISGPPAFLHMHGQTYVPAETQAPGTAAVAKTVAAVETAHEPSPRVLSEEEIERRVRERVESWAASQRKPVYSSAAPCDGRKQLKGRAMTDEERAAERIHSVNAGMRGRYNSPF